MTQTIETTWGFEHYREDAVSPHPTTPPWGGAGGEQQGFHLFVQTERERPITPLLHFLSLGQQPNGHINNAPQVQRELMVP